MSIKRQKDCISSSSPFDVMIKQRNTEQWSRLFNITKIKYMHDRNGDIFDHHLMLYSKDRLVFKVWLLNKKNDKEYANVKEAMNEVNMVLVDDVETMVDVEPDMVE